MRVREDDEMALSPPGRDANMAGPDEPATRMVASLGGKGAGPRQIMVATYGD
jgi:hypothetical protein